MDGKLRWDNFWHFIQAIEENKRKKILVVDDDKIIVETIVQSLEEDANDYEVISASDGFEAGLQVNHFSPDLLILDIMMPGMTGLDVLKVLRPSNPVPVIMLTARGDDVDRIIERLNS